jgi:hypothetical protein
MALRSSTKRRRLNPPTDTESEDADNPIYQIPIEIWVQILQTRSGRNPILTPMDIYRFGCVCHPFYRVALLALNWTPICRAIPHPYKSRTKSMDKITEWICHSCLENRLTCLKHNSLCYRCDVGTTFAIFVEDHERMLHNFDSDSDSEPEPDPDLFSGEGLEDFCHYLAHGVIDSGDSPQFIMESWIQWSRGEYGPMPLLYLDWNHIPKVCTGRSIGCVNFLQFHWLHPFKWMRRCGKCKRNLMTECIACLLGHLRNGVSIRNWRVNPGHSIGRFHGLRLKTIDQTCCGKSWDIAVAAPNTDSCACPEYTWRFLLDAPLSCGQCQKPFRNSTICVRHSTCIKCLQFFCQECLADSRNMGGGGFADLIDMGFLPLFCPRCIVIYYEYPIRNQLLYSGARLGGMSRKEKDLYCLHQLYLSLPLY